VVFAGLLLPMGRLGDVIGQRRVFFTGMLLFAAASAACAVSPSVLTLVAARIVQAAGAAIPEGMAVVPAADSHVTGRQWPDAGVSANGRTAPPLPLSPHGGPPVSGPAAGWARSGATGTGTGARQSGAQPALRQTGPQPAVRQSSPPAQPPRAATGSASPRRPTGGSTWPTGVSRTRSEPSNGAAGAAGKPAATPFWARSRRRSK